MQEVKIGKDEMPREKDDRTPFRKAFETHVVGDVVETTQSRKSILKNTASSIDCHVADILVVAPPARSLQSHLFGFVYWLFRLV